eukprot:6296423-Prymnesium_polylepis.1
MMNAGFRFIPPELDAVILLNLLIAMMGGYLAKIRVDSELMAYMERAKLVLQHDEVEGFYTTHAQTEKQGTRDKRASCSFLSRLRRWMRDMFRRQKQKGLEKRAPKWLHVLMPVTEYQGLEVSWQATNTHATLLKQLTAGHKAMEAIFA